MLNDEMLPHAKVDKINDENEAFSLKIPSFDEEQEIIKKLLRYFNSEFYKVHRTDLLERTKKLLDQRTTQKNLIDPNQVSDVDLWMLHRNLYQQVEKLSNFLQTHIEIKNKYKKEQYGTCNETDTKTLACYNKVIMETNAHYEKVMNLMKMVSNAQLLKMNLADIGDQNSQTQENYIECSPVEINNVDYYYHEEGDHELSSNDQIYNKVFGGFEEIGLFPKNTNPTDFEEIECAQDYSDSEISMGTAHYGYQKGFEVGYYLCDIDIENLLDTKNCCYQNGEEIFEDDYDSTLKFGPDYIGCNDIDTYLGFNPSCDGNFVEDIEDN